MVWNSEFGRFIPDLAWRLALVCGVGCCGGACRARGLGTYGASRGIAFSQLVS
jgi:hypothetical protein